MTSVCFAGVKAEPVAFPIGCGLCTLCTRLFYSCMIFAQLRGTTSTSPPSAVCYLRYLGTYHLPPCLTLPASHIKLSQARCSYMPRVMAPGSNDGRSSFTIIYLSKTAFRGCPTVHLDSGTQVSSTYLNQYQDILTRSLGITQF